RADQPGEHGHVERVALLRPGQPDVGDPVGDLNRDPPLRHRRSSGLVLLWLQSRTRNQSPPAGLNAIDVTSIALVWGWWDPALVLGAADDPVEGGDVAPVGRPAGVCEAEPDPLPRVADGAALLRVARLGERGQVLAQRGFADVQE